MSVSRIDTFFTCAKLYNLYVDIKIKLKKKMLDKK